MRERTREQISAVLFAAGVIVVGGVGAWQLAKDGSFWLDEASVARSLLALSPAELLGPLDGQQSFPRLYLLCIDFLTRLFGFETLVARALPHCFFLAATVGWLRLLHLRFREQPALLAVGVGLTLIPAPWFVYGATLKPYTFDVCAALVPFLLSDAFYEETLERGERTWRLVALTALGALSYPYALVLLARVGGWWLAGIHRGRVRLDPVGAASWLGGMALFFGCLWWTDLRHTGDIESALRGFWGACILGTEGTDTFQLLDRAAFGWWDGRTEFSGRAGLPEGVLFVLKLGLALGIVRGFATFVRSDAALPAGWGSRSAGCGSLLAGLLAASFLAGYPICAGRLTLIALLPLQISILEGIDWAGWGARRLQAGSWLAAAGGVALVAMITPSTFDATKRLAAASAPEDLRPALRRAARRPDLPILSNTCTRRQLETLPEGVDHDLLYLEEGGGIAVAIGTREAWVLYSPYPICRNAIQHLRQKAETWTPMHEPGSAVKLIYLELPQPADDAQ